jgi:hypothetical protein
MILNESNEQYHASGAWGSTLINQFLSSPRLANAMRKGEYKKPETAAFRFGRMFHELLDPNSGFDKHYRLGPGNDRRTKAWKDAQVEGIQLVTVDDWDALHRMAESVRANPFAACLLENAMHEVGFRMDADQGPFKIQCRADIMHADHIADLKTTADIDDFSKSIANYGYHRQAALYRYIISRECGNKLPFSFIVVENAEPFYRCRVVDLSPEYLSIGWDDIEKALIDIGRRSISGNWNDGQDAIQIDPPGWLTRAA